jgi:uncharacterized protein (DUF1330 family)
MVAYLMVRADVHDKEAYGEYAKRSPAVVAQFGGRYLARGGETISLEGAQESRRCVIIEFPSLAAAKAFYDSPEYQSARAFRKDAGDAEFIVVDGYNGS